MKSARDILRFVCELQDKGCVGTDMYEHLTWTTEAEDLLNNFIYESVVLDYQKSLCPACDE